MKSSDFARVLRPSRQQDLLLCATLQQGKCAAEAWQKWGSSLYQDSLEPGMYRLLPQLFHNLVGQGVKDPLVEKLRGIYRHTWYKNRISLHRVADLLPALGRAGFETIVLKEAAMVLLQRFDYDPRPLGCLEILVRAKDMRNAARLVEELGWNLEPGSPKSFLGITASIGLGCGARQQLIIHGQLFSGDHRLEDSDEVWDASIQTRIEGLETRSLSPTDELLYAIAQDVERSPVPWFSWVADAALIIESSPGEIDWDRLTARARERRLTLPLWNALYYLASDIGLSVPSPALAKLQAVSPSRTESLEHWATARRQKPLERLVALWFRYARLTNGAGLQERIVAMPKLLQHAFSRSSSR